MRLARFRLQSVEVLHAQEDVLRVDGLDADALGAAARAAPRGRTRICAHRGAGDRVHEMLIALDGNGYVRPHRHPGRPESFHVISGHGSVLLFDEHGRPSERIRIGEHVSGRTFYLRIDAPVFHTILVESELLLVHETTAGPLDPASTEQAPWAPGGDDVHGGRRFLAAALARIEEGS